MTHFMPVTPSAAAPASAPTPATALSLGLGQFPELGLPVSLLGCCWGAAGGSGGQVLWAVKECSDCGATCLGTAACKQALSKMCAQTMLCLLPSICHRACPSWREAAAALGSQVVPS